MNYNFLSQLVDNGISEEELIASLSKSIPRLAKQAKKMFFGGWSPKDVLGMFSKDKEVQKFAKKGLKPVTPAEMASLHLQNSYNNIPQSQNQESLEKMTDFTKKVAPYALGAIASPIAGSVIQSALDRALPRNESLSQLPVDQKSSMLQLPETGKEQIQVLNGDRNYKPQQPPLDLGNANITQQANIEQTEENIDKLNKLWLGFEKGRDKGFDFESDAFLKIAKKMKSTGSIKSKEDFQTFYDLYEKKISEGKD